VTLIGRGAEALPYLIVSLRELGEGGLGVARARFKVAHITTRDAEPKVVFDEEGIVHSTRGRSITLDPSKLAAFSDATDRRTYSFLTPVLLKTGGMIEEVPSYGTLVKRTRDRVNALSTFFGDGAFEWDFRAMGDDADRVRTVSATGAKHTHSRFSKRRGRTHDLSGFLGEVTYEGPSHVLARFDPLLDAVDDIHVGKGAAFGNGWIRRRRT
jgi:hypothetical protein